MSESTQKKLDRVRPPRVQITYDVETGGAIEMKEIPFTVGIMADLSGKPEKPLPKLKERKFVEIDRDNINDVMASITPRLAYQVPNKLQNDGSKLNVLPKFQEMEDFDPVQVLKQIGPLAKLFEARKKLSDLLTKLDGNDNLDALLSDVVASTEQQRTLQAEIGGEDADAAKAPADVK